MKADPSVAALLVSLDTQQFDFTGCYYFCQKGSRKSEYKTKSLSI